MKLLQMMFVALLMGLAVTASAVDQDVKVDLLMAKITTLLKAEKTAEALPYFAELEGMEPSLNSSLPESFHFFYIEALEKSGNKKDALSRAEAYLSKYGKNGKYYGKVIEIMSRVEMQVVEEAKVAKEAAAEQERKKRQVIVEKCKELVAKIRSDVKRHCSIHYAWRHEEYMSDRRNDQLKEERDQIDERLPSYRNEYRVRQCESVVNDSTWDDSDCSN